MAAPTPEQINHLRVFLSQREVTSLLLEHGGAHGRAKERVDAQANALRTLLTDWRRRGAQIALLHTVLAAVGATPHGFCCCPTKDATKPEDQHIPECRAARAALRETEATVKEAEGLF